MSLSSLTLAVALAAASPLQAAGAPPGVVRPAALRCRQGAAQPNALAGLPSYPPCFDVTLSAEATGKPPLTYTWTLPGGQVLTGNPATLDTALLQDGYNEVLLEVTNAAGSAAYPEALVVEALGFDAPPDLVVTSGTTVAATANTRGATEWRWSWGDGTVTGWTGGCAGYAPTHTYAATGDYTVEVEARSCRSGPVAMSGTLALGTGTDLSIDRFAAVCPEAPFCSAAVGEAVAFETVVSGTPEAYLYDWNGDGLDDEVAAAPVASHVFAAAGIFTPRVTVYAGAFRDSAVVAAPVEVLGTGGLLFSHGFESGNLSGWVVP